MSMFGACSGVNPHIMKLYQVFSDTFQALSAPVCGLCLWYKDFFSQVSISSIQVHVFQLSILSLAKLFFCFKLARGMNKPETAIL